MAETDPPDLQALKANPAPSAQQARKAAPAKRDRRDRQAPKAQQVVKALAELRALWGHKDQPAPKATPDPEA